ncbi:uncharacterized protein LOC144135203 [Amblyomma americanum]
MGRSTALGVCLWMLLGLEVACSCFFSHGDPDQGRSHYNSDFCDSYYTSQLQNALDSALRLPAEFSSDFTTANRQNYKKPFVVTGLNWLRRSGPLRSYCELHRRVLKFKLESTMPVVTTLKWNIGLDGPVNITYHGMSVALEMPVYREITSDCHARAIVPVRPRAFSLHSSQITVDDQHGRLKDKFLRHHAERWAGAIIKKSLIDDHIVENMDRMRLSL